VNTITIFKNDKTLKGEISLPASKSISNRALIIKHLSAGKTKITNLSDAEDTRLMQSLLEMTDENHKSENAVVLDCQNAGTVLRFLTAYLSAKPGRWILTGSERMKQRPVGPLVNALKELGARIIFQEKEGFPPLQIDGKLFSGGMVELESSISSQFVSALIMIAPCLNGGLKILLESKVISEPYIRMTLEMLRNCGIKSEYQNQYITIGQQEFNETGLIVEPDWSSASYWFEMAAFSDHVDLTLKDLKKESLQGDSILPEIYNKFGVKTEFLNEGIRLTKTNQHCTHFDFDFSNHPDLAQEVIATCAGLNIPAKLTGLESLRIKETDRIEAMASELSKSGFNISVENESCLMIEPSIKIQSPNFKPLLTYSDHRMAMALAPLAILSGSVQIENPGVVKKSYPGFWDDLKKAGFDFLIKPV
jgi:3-phosphoshikimate 1-carboxyvinyltransferase